ncbi:ATP-dependent RecD-like DNA helicase [Aestuariibacter sp. AA17]|uniref:DNA 3'-5' helicase II n=1 Tax=Fluctibacter corallii TaxID=2984329 RepID=A0ABT3A5C7_9ALTE|nr:ATP-dependent RecD-like DNA helicase [Aestuariibacter sp. AA17]MCV2883875.1 ATP-dependent RecD-like DNA helicase [Aestuariibacter sp. AA17]
MRTIYSQVISSNEVISQSINNSQGQRGLLSQIILGQIRNLLEGVAVYIHQNDPNLCFDYHMVNPALQYVGSRAKYRIVSQFHALTQKSTSHYSLDGDNSERLMLKYYEYLYRLRSLVRNELGVTILENLEVFPIDLDPSLREYHQKIADRIRQTNAIGQDATKERYYIHKTKPFFNNGEVFYEVTFYPAQNKVNKFDRIIGFTKIDIADKYAAELTVQRSAIDVLGFNMPILLILRWEVSIRPCELDNYARLLGFNIKTSTTWNEYTYLMQCLTESFDSLLDIVDMSDEGYAAYREVAVMNVVSPRIFPVLDKTRALIKANCRGSNVLRYLLLHMNNRILKQQYNQDGCYILSDLMLHFGCIPFDDMPFCSSLPGHNPRIGDLFECLDASTRLHEVLARRIKNNIEREGNLYTPVGELEELGNILELSQKYNRKVHRTHTDRHLVHDKGHLFITGYENDTVKIIEKLISCADGGLRGYEPFVTEWLGETPFQIDDQAKLSAIEKLFSESKVALIYGAAGTGKSTMLSHLAHMFNDRSKLFLAHTNPATDNLKRKISAQNSEFSTIRSHLSNGVGLQHYDLLVIDECSTVCNTDILNVIEKTPFELLVLVGDIYQIESIQFGNWFEIIKDFVPNTAVFELNTPYRTTNESLLAFWDKVRQCEDDIAESIARNGYSAVLDNTLFQSMARDEIILCLNYDGLYGINNVNRFLQAGNPNPEVRWRANSFKVNDPVLFTDSERFRPVIFNNLKGWIKHIEKAPGWIQFDIKLDRPLTELDVMACHELEWMGDSTVRLVVFDYDPNTSDEDDESSTTIIPFQVAYAVSIHKAQGLEYDSVKIVITDANEDDISHSIFYTAVTRARESLKIFWTPETQQHVLNKLKRGNRARDVHLIRNRRLMPR